MAMPKNLMDRLMRSNPGLRVRRRAFDMMPTELLDDCRY